MKWYAKILIGFCVFVILLWIIGRATNAIQFYTVSTASNEPALKQGHYFFSSNLIKPEHNDFICFKHNDEQFGKSVWIFRLCGSAGDKIEIKNGTLFVNDRNADATLHLYHTFMVGIQEFNILDEKLKFDENQYFQQDADSFFIFTSEKMLKDNNVTGNKQIDPKEREDGYIEKIWKNKWNKDNFGPVTVPADKYFVMGDNRDNAQDSRYIGFVDEKDITGTALGKY